MVQGYGRSQREGLSDRGWGHWMEESTELGVRTCVCSAQQVACSAPVCPEGGLTSAGGGLRTRRCRSVRGPVAQSLGQAPGGVGLCPTPTPPQLGRWESEVRGAISAV